MKEKLLSSSELKPRLSRNTLKYNLWMEVKLMLPEEKYKKLIKLTITFLLRNGLKLMIDLPL